ncbi:macro domain-containing protein [bacterium]|nr:macro domain-containing protein [bacterium]
MGKGIAYQFKERFPENNKAYVKACKSGDFTIGKILFFEEDGKIIANFPTKNRWREKSEYSYIDSGLEALKAGIIERNIKSLAIPPLGCGNGGLNWNIVKQKIIEKFSNLDVDITIYEPSTVFTPKPVLHKMSASHLILMRLKIALKPIGKIRLQKAAFFLNIFSGSNYFKFIEYKHGPYDHNIEVLSQHIKDFQEIYNVNTDTAQKILYNNIISDSVKETIEKYTPVIKQATNFVNSISDNHELEIVATVVAIVKGHPQFKEDEIVHYFLKDWPKEDPKQFSEEEIKNSLTRLIKSDIVIQNLFGYFISDETQKNSDLLPTYQL